MACTREDITSITLLSMEEFNSFHELFPVAKCWWWLRTPGSYKRNAQYVFADGEAYKDGYKVSSDKACIRPAFYLSKAAVAGLNPGDKLEIGKYSATLLEGNYCLLDEGVCNHRFAVVSNDWDSSEIKAYIESEEFMNLIFG